MRKSPWPLLGKEERRFLGPESRHGSRRHDFLRLRAVDKDAKRLSFAFCVRKDLLLSCRDRDFRSAGKGFWADIPDEQWNDWRWQLRHRLASLEEIAGHLRLTDSERGGILLASSRKLALAITPYFFTLLSPDDPDCPIRRQVIPRSEELLRAPYEMSDPCGEDGNMVAPGLVHRYPDRVLFLVTDRCASYCRYCTRSRIVSGVGEQHLAVDMDRALAYLWEHREVRDVLLSGGDPLLLSDGRLRELLGRLREIPHIEIVRIGTRVPIFLPQRLTSDLCELLRTFHPLWINIHANHAAELTAEVRDALGRLADAGIPLGNQSVLLRGINDSVGAVRDLVHKLVRARVRPYYLYQCDLIEGTDHFRVPIEEGIRIMRELRGYTTGFAVPQYVVDGPGGGGKIPLNPEYIVGEEGGQILLHNFLGKLYRYPSPPSSPEGAERTPRERAS